MDRKETIRSTYRRDCRLGALSAFTVRANYERVRPQYRKNTALLIWMSANAVWAGRAERTEESEK